MTLNLTTLNKEKCNPSLISPLGLAFVGDAVFDLMVRKYYLKQANRPVKKLHNLVVKRVCAQAQAEAAGLIFPMLTDEEQAVFRRGRNAHTSHTPKNASVEDYHLSTAFECLIGYLYLADNNQRIDELFDVIKNSWEE
ncbi:MAG TPA: ribonuclease III domain-containing protein [Clostridia bacterium]|nr:ribonuclease III domain-containing protein [Clostridia bacterium]